MKNTPCVIEGYFEKGHVVLCSPHFEQNKNLDLFTFDLILNSIIKL
jgi:hypothetical protein